MLFFFLASFVVFSLLQRIVLVDKIDIYSRSVFMAFVLTHHNHNILTDPFVTLRRISFSFSAIDFVYNFRFN